VRQFIDIVGASGSIYRFQRIGDPRQLPATAGNFLFSRASGDQEQVICCGTARSLMLAGEVWGRAVEQHRAETIFMRLNVSRTVRASEHVDIVERQCPIMVVTELD
jgi:hypothetical protein